MSGNDEDDFWSGRWFIGPAVLAIIIAMAWYGFYL